MNLLQRIRSKVIREAALLRLNVASAMMGSTDFEYWGKRQDDSVKGVNLDTLPNTWGPRSQLQFEFLRSIGLAPDHRFLDYGCARVATGEVLIPWLKPGKYVGCDVAATSLRWGQRRLTAKGVDRAQYHLICVRSPELSELEGFAFDFIWSYSVLQFLDESSLRKVLRRFVELLAPGGRICLTYSVPEDRAILERKGMHVHLLERYQTMLADLTCRVEHPDIGNGKANIVIASK